LWEPPEGLHPAARHHAKTAHKMRIFLKKAFAWTPIGMLAQSLHLPSTPTTHKSGKAPRR
jgi:hypothetical protein